VVIFFMQCSGWGCAALCGERSVYQGASKCRMRTQLFYK
jgi:hypothetical protein